MSRCPRVVAGVVAGLLPLVAAGEERGSGDRAEVKLMTVNVGWMGSGGGWLKRHPVMIGAIRAHDPDIIGFQEPQRVQRDALARDLPGYAAWGNLKGRAADGGQEGNPVFFREDRFRIDTGESGRFWLSDTPEVPGSKTWDNKYVRICEMVRLIDKRTGDALYVYNSHWSFSRNAANLKGARLILDRIQRRSHDDPVVLMGDFNATRDDPSIEWISGGHPHVTLRDAFTFMDPNPARAGTFHKAFDGVPSGKQIDYILIDPGRFEVIDATVVKDHREGLYPSDHFPLMATVVPRPFAAVPDQPADKDPVRDDMR